MDNERFCDLLGRYEAAVFRVAFNFLRNRDDAEDVTQDVFVKLYRSNVDFADDDHARRWLLRVAVNECRSLYRALRRRPEPIDDVIETLEAPEDDDPAQAAQGTSDVLKCVLSLPEKYRVVIYLYYFEDLSTEEIAELLHKPVSTVRTHLSRGRARLESMIGGGQ